VVGLVAADHRVDIGRQGCRCLDDYAEDADVDAGWWIPL
jgi:hypothetical protein